MDTIGVFVPSNAKLPLEQDVSTVKTHVGIYDVQPPGSYLSSSQVFFNGFNYPIKVVLRSGLAYILQPEINLPTAMNSRLTVRSYIRYRSNVKFDLAQLSDVLGTDPKGRHKAINDAYNNSTASMSVGYHTVAVDYTVEMSNVTTAEAGVYIPDLDIVITRFTNIVTYHPFSSGGLILRKREELGNDSFNYRLTIVDPDGNFGMRHINIGNIAYKIPVVKDVSREEGVYHEIFSSDGAGYQSKYYSFETADKALMLFRTRDEAMSFGNLADARKQEHDDAMHKAKLEGIRLQQEMDTVAHERKKLESDMKRKDLEMASLKDELKHEREIRKLRREDHYEERSYDRKDVSEIMKWIPPLIVSLAIIVAKFAATGGKAT
mgnify:CR=1 FL=1